MTRPHMLVGWSIGLALLACTADAHEEGPVVVIGDLSIHDAYAPAPITPDVAALYFTIRNAGALPDRILAVHVDVADSASLHTQTRSGAGTRMQSLESLPVPAAGEARLAPGGDHVMLTGLRRDYQAGDTIQAEVVLERAGPLRFGVPVIEYAELDGKFADARR